MTELMVNYGAGFGEILTMILCRIPRIILFAMPVACLMAVLLSFIRMASDNEIVALHSSGISLYQLMSPVIIFSIICFLFAGFLTLFGVPYGNRTLESVKVDVMKTRIDALIKEGVFIDEFEDAVIYVNSYSPKDRVMKDAFFVYKENDKVTTIIAKKAKFIAGTIRFIDCIVFTDGKDGSSMSGKSGYSEYPLPSDSLLKNSENNKIEPDGMYFSELLELINKSDEDAMKKNIAKLKLYEMISVPMGILIIGIAGAPLGAQIRAHGRTKGIIISMLLFLSYYGIFISVESIFARLINPAVCVWFPVLFLLILCIFFLLRSAGKLSFKYHKVSKAG